MISAIIPCYDEAANIVEFANRLETALKPLCHYEIIFMVGGTDDTYELLRDWAAGRLNVWIVYERERGLGRAIKNAVPFINHAADWVLTMDADLQQLPEEISKLWGPMGYDIVIGSKGSNDSRGRGKRFISKALYRIYRYTHGIQVRDMGSNFRLYRRDVLLKLSLDRAPDGYKFMQFVLLEAWKNGATICEIPTTFALRKFGKSKMSWKRELWERLH